MTIRSYQDLDIWKRSMTLVTAVYAISDGFPKSEQYGLTSQLRRSAVSIPSNIAEGRAKRTTRDFMRFLNIAYGSMAELETQLMIAANLQYCTSADIAPLLEETAEIARMTNGLLQSLEQKLTLTPES